MKTINLRDSQAIVTKISFASIYDIKSELIGHEIQIGKRVIIGDNVTLGHGCIIGDNCSIGAGCVIGYDAKISPGSIIGANCIIGIDTYIGVNVKIGVGCVVDYDTYICDDAVIGADTYIGYDCNIRQKTVIGDGCFIGKKVDTAIGITISNGITIPGNSSLRRNVTRCLVIQSSKKVVYSGINNVQIGDESFSIEGWEEKFNSGVIADYMNNDKLNEYKYYLSIIKNINNTWS